ncbi:MAG: hypothetical protein M3459_06910 [Actinomycetota bacterium]|nr:hypothetical protein [Actinomycetota bacterium]
MTRREVPLDAAELLRALERGRVEYVVVGGLAVQAHGHVRTTQDLDLVPEPSTENLDRLARSLAALGARPAGTAKADPPSVDELSRAEVTTLDTDAGGVDVHRDPPGAAPYAHLRARALVLEVAGAPVAFAGLDDLIAMKRASGRPIDRGDVLALTEGEADR